MDFRIWGTITPVGDKYFITVSAVSDTNPSEVGGVETAEADTDEIAEDLCRRMVIRLAARMREFGHAVVDTEAI
jgi:hypothetical protein